MDIYSQRSHVLLGSLVNVAHILVVGLTIFAIGANFQNEPDDIQPSENYITQVVQAVEARLVFESDYSVPSVHACPEAVEMMVLFEVGSEANYNRRLRYPIWPEGQSGITYGIGYDGGFQTRSRILADWHAHPQAELLASTAGIKGARARDALPGFRSIEVTWEQAFSVFRDSTVPRFETLARRSFGPGFETAPPCVQLTLTGLVKNRGSSMFGPSRAEMREIRDNCLPLGDAQCVARNLAAMCRLWEGMSVYRGLCSRRIQEGQFIVANWQV